MGKKNKKKRKSPSTGESPNGGVSLGVSSPAVDNPLYDQQIQFLTQSGRLTEKERYEIFSPDIPTERRAKLWMEQAELGESLVNKYAWATPDSTAIRILKEFSPLIEIGCGSNAYWCRTMKKAGIDIIGYDVNVEAGGQINDIQKKQKQTIGKNKNKNKSSAYLKQGGPEVLSSEKIRNSGRSLFLCYPDEDDAEEMAEANEVNDDFDEEEDALPKSMGWQCLDNYSGDHVIHVGEIFLDPNLSMEQAPWGRSSSPEFQQRLANEFHCILKVELPNWLHTRDSISVWKRSTICPMVFAADEKDDGDDDEEDEDEEVEYRHIPRAERLPMNVAAPCCVHLLPGTDRKSQEDSALAGAAAKATRHSEVKSKSHHGDKAPAKSSEAKQLKEEQKKHKDNPQKTKKMKINHSHRKDKGIDDKSEKWKAMDAALETDSNEPHW